MAAGTPLNRLALAAGSVADDLGYVALNDLAGALGDMAADYRVIGGHMVTMLAARWQLGAALYRETGDVDLGIPPIVARDHHLASRPEELTLEADQLRRGPPRSLHTAIGFVVGSDGFPDDVRLARRDRLAETEQRPAVFGPAQRPDLGIRELMHPEIRTEPSPGLEVRDEDHDCPQEHGALRGGELDPIIYEGSQKIVGRHQESASDARNSASDR